MKNDTQEKKWPCRHGIFFRVHINGGSWPKATTNKSLYTRITQTMPFSPKPLCKRMRARLNTDSCLWMARGEVFTSLALSSEFLLGGGGSPVLRPPPRRPPTAARRPPGHTFTALWHMFPPKTYERHACWASGAGLRNPT